MHKITLITTAHAEKGLCNAAELNKILERARPEIIFVEITASSFDRYRIEAGNWNLESKATNLYVEKHGATKLEPVDVCDDPDDLIAANKHLHQRVEEGAAREYRWLIDRHSQRVKLYGFAYLNSTYCVEFWLELDDLIKEGLRKIGENELFRTYEWWKQVNEQREEGMVKNIQKYCEEHEFTSGLFLVGAAHRRSIIEKSRNQSPNKSVTLDWNFEKYAGLIDV